MYPKQTDEQLENRFLQFTPQGSWAGSYVGIRAGCLELAKLVRDLTPVSLEQALAINALDQCMLLASAAIARNATS